MRQEVSSSEITEYLPMVKALAQKFSGRQGAEVDDLVQEGLLSVWAALRRGKKPKASHIEGRMKNWIRHLSGKKSAPKKEDMVPWQGVEETYSGGPGDPD